MYSIGSDENLSGVRKYRNAWGPVEILKFPHPTTSGRISVSGIPTLSDELPSDLPKSYAFLIRIRQDSIVKSLILGAIDDRSEIFTHNFLTLVHEQTKEVKVSDKHFAWKLFPSFLCDDVV